MIGSVTGGEDSVRVQNSPSRKFVTLEIGFESLRVVMGSEAQLKRRVCNIFGMRSEISREARVNPRRSQVGQACSMARVYSPQRTQRTLRGCGEMQSLKNLQIAFSATPLCALCLCGEYTHAVKRTWQATREWGSPWFVLKLHSNDASWARDVSP